MTTGVTESPIGRREWTGLDEADARRLLASGGGNDFRPASSRTVGQILRANVCTRFNALLGSLLVVILVVGPIQDSLFGLTLILNTAIGTFQELRAKRALDKLTVVTAPRATVTRSGRVRTIPASEVVLGDVMHLSAGDQVTVDAEVLESQGALVDESLLTGESHPLPKDEGDGLLSGSFVAGGSLICRATAVGADSYAAKLGAEARQFTLAPSELRDGINLILRIVTWVLVPVAALLIWSQFTRGGAFGDAVRASVAGTVVMVPEGLVLLASLALAIGALRLARRRVLARDLLAIEGLARVDTLCIDKTGTLTTGRLVVDDVEVLVADGRVDEALAALAHLEPVPNATMQALRARFGAPPQWNLRKAFPFDSAHKWSAGDFGPAGRWVIGAPDVLAPNDDALQVEVDRRARGGKRVLLLGRVEVLPLTLEQTVAPVALLTLSDELRADAESTLGFLRDQRVEIKVISGDHPGTAASVARRVGIDDPDPVDARQIATASDLDEAISRHCVFGRVVPEQKREIVAALKRAGHVVAMTGDGVNDVLALKLADVGIAMSSGASASRAVSQLVLLDNSFSAVPAVIGEGRRVIANVERVGNLFITKTVYATVLALAVGLARLPFPFLPRHLTLVSTMTIGIPAFFLALAPNDRRARPHFVARIARFAIPAGLVAAGATYLAYVEAREDAATSLTAARTLATLVLSAVALWILAILVRPGRREAWVVPAMAAGLLIALLLPPLRDFFGLRLPGSLLLLAGIGAVSLSGFVLELGWRLAGWVRSAKRGGT